MPREADAPSQRTDATAHAPMRLAGLLAARAADRPQALVLQDPPGRETWSGRPASTWTASAAHAFVQRFAAVLRGFDLPAGTGVGIALANMSEAGLAILAVEAADLLPCLLPIAWSDDELAAAVTAAKVEAIITQGTIADLRPAELFARIAAGYFPLRFLCAFGPHVPDGVLDLDRVLADTPPPASAPGDHRPDAAIVTFARSYGSPRAFLRSTRSLVAAAAVVLGHAAIGPEERIVSLLAQDDLAGLATGLVAGLVSGAALECHGWISEAALVEAVAGHEPVRVVAPAWMEAGLTVLPPRAKIVAPLLVRRAQDGVPPGPPPSFGVDVLALEELALLCRPRGVVADHPRHLVLERLLQMRRDADGCIAVRGLATEAQPYVPARLPFQGPWEWHRTTLPAESWDGPFSPAS